MLILTIVSGLRPIFGNRKGGKIAPGITVASLRRYMKGRAFRIRRLKMQLEIAQRLHDSKILNEYFEHRDRMAEAADRPEASKN